MQKERRPGYRRLETIGRRGRWIAILIAVIGHIALFTLVPAYEIPVRPRMVVVLGEWGPPAGVGGGSVAATGVTGESALAGFAVPDSIGAGPRLVNHPHVNHRVPRLYPWLLWQFREPSTARVQVVLNSRGRVIDAELVDGEAGAGELALLELARLMRFDVGDVRARGVVGTIEIAVAVPLGAAR